MRKEDVIMDQIYLVKVSNNIVPVRLTSLIDMGGWYGENLITGRNIRIKTAGRLRRMISEDESNKIIKSSEITKSIPSFLKNLAK